MRIMTSIWNVCVRIGLVLTFCCVNSAETSSSTSSPLPTRRSLFERCFRNETVPTTWDRFKPYIVKCSGMDNCCLEENRNASKFNLSCHSAYNDFPRTMNTSKTSRPTMDYEMVTRCPDGQSCANENLNESTLVTFDDIVVVYSEDHQVIFMNKRCAECNGVDSYQRWKFMAADCMNFDYTQTRLTDRELLAYIVGNCVLFSFPTNRTIVKYQRHRCDMSDIKREAESCITTGDNVTIGNSDFTAGLESSTFSDQRTPTRISCFLCKDGAAVIVTKTCPLNEHQNPLDNFNLTFDMDLDYDWAEQLTLGKQEICKENEIYDVYYNICRRFICTGFERLRSRSCKNIFPFKIDPVVYTVDLILVPSKQETVNGTIESSDNTELLRSLKNALSLNKCTIHVTLMKLYFVAETRVVHSMFLKMQIKNSPFCSYQYLSGKFTSLYTIQKRLFITTFRLNALNNFEFIIRQSYRIRVFSYSLGKQTLINVNGFYQSQIVTRLSHNATYSPPLYEIDARPGCARIAFNVSNYCQLMYIQQSENAFPVNKTCVQFFDNALDYEALQSWWLPNYTSPRDFYTCLRAFEFLMKKMVATEMLGQSNSDELKTQVNSSSKSQTFWYISTFQVMFILSFRPKI